MIMELHCVKLKGYVGVCQGTLGREGRGRLASLKQFFFDDVEWLQKSNADNFQPILTSFSSHLDELVPWTLTRIFPHLSSMTGDGKGAQGLILTCPNSCVC